jgi:ribosomal protein S18 acetylase RimI-like enzyme
VGPGGVSERRIRVANKDDLETLLSCTKLTYEEHCAQQPGIFFTSEELPTVEWLKTSVGVLHSKHLGWFSICLVCEAEAEFLGYILVVLSPTSAGKDRHEIIATVFDVYTTPAVRRMGIGSALVEAAMLAAMERGVTLFDSFIRTWNVASITTFESLGFQKVSSGFVKRVNPTIESKIPVQLPGMPKLLILPWDWKSKITLLTTLLFAQFILIVAVIRFFTR